MGVHRMTIPRLLLLRALLADPTTERYGLDLALQAGLEPGSVYPILVAFENAGWLESRVEDVDASAAGRPRRRYYRLTAEGVEAGRTALAEAARKRRPGTAGGELAW
ncbi:PadR family transcriptional regulator [Couchioplanes caeruleus]|uniref:PadR family transcriptional regulator n=1 Tax=Couchioplanes caeruleus TaxID=56438 RepID=UPI0020C08580|nr:PadR family transcriptional regulator [Couchioplanes caeruleus]UQU67830.1 PadR family transcriptional regulator [Couchioplanes caeruleus]